MKPKSPEERATRVAAAVRTLEKIGATFTVEDVAERAGLSRATIYRTPQLRALIGAKGDGQRTVAADVHAKICARHESGKARVRDLRKQVADTERAWEIMRERALVAERRVAEAQQRVQSLEIQMNGAGSAGTAPLAAVAMRMSPEAIRRARRLMARALHPDLFTHDDEAAALATELLKMVNGLAG
jgi:hypothetical protein